MMAYVKMYNALGFFYSRVKESVQNSTCQPVTLFAVVTILFETWEYKWIYLNMRRGFSDQLVTTEWSEKV